MRARQFEGRRPQFPAAAGVLAVHEDHRGAAGRSRQIPAVQGDPATT